MKNKIDGTALAASFKVVASCGNEINALKDALNNLFTEAISHHAKFLCDVHPSGEDRMDNSEWVYTDIAYSFPLKLRHQSKNKSRIPNEADAYLGYQISMIGSSIAAYDNNEPVIHIFFWKEAVSFKDDCFMSYPLDTNQKVYVRNNRLIEWESECSDKETYSEWVFSLRLTSLSSSEDLKRYIIDPAIKLLNGEDVLTALPDNIEGIIRYPDNYSLIDETDNSDQTI